MLDSAYRLSLQLKKAKILWSYIKHFWILAGAKKCRTLIGLCKKAFSGWPTIFLGWRNKTEVSASFFFLLWRLLKKKNQHLWLHIWNRKKEVSFCKSSGPLKGGKLRNWGLLLPFPNHHFLKVIYWQIIISWLRFLSRLNLISTDKNFQKSKVYQELNQISSSTNTGDQPQRSSYDHMQHLRWCFYAEIVDG